MPVLFTVKTPDEVHQLISEHFGTIHMDSVSIPLIECSGRYTAVDIFADEDVPGFNRSTVDGYAVKSADTFGASESLPAMLKYVGAVSMGVPPAFSIHEGECAYVPTGGEIPEGADAMVMIEYADDYHDGFIYLQKPAAPGSGLIFRGDDTRKGTVVIPKGTLIRAQEIGAMAALGLSSVLCMRKPKVGIISTGDEIIEIDQQPKGAQIRDVNTWVIRSGIDALGAEPVSYGIIPDNLEQLEDIVLRALKECDLVLISGGSSTGERDFTMKVLNESGKPGVFIHGIAIKPGKPTLIADCNGKPVFGLPGHPVSAFFIFQLFAAPLIRAMLGTRTNASKFESGVMSVNVPSNQGREEYIPVQLTQTENGLTAEPIHNKSGLIMGLIQAQGYVRIPRDKEGLMACEKVTILLF